MEELILTTASFVSIILPFFNVVTWGILIGASRRGEKSVALEERKTVAFILTVASFILGAIGANSLLMRYLGVGIESPFPLIALATVVVLISLPSLIFLYKFVAGDFDGKR